jgi:hypothetical protein
MGPNNLCVKISWYFQPLVLCAAEEGIDRGRSGTANAELGRWIFSDIKMLREQSLGATLSGRVKVLAGSVLRHQHLA